MRCFALAVLLLVSASAVGQRPEISVTSEGGLTRIAGSSDVISVNASGQVCPWSPDGKWLALQHAGYGYVLADDGDQLTLKSWTPPQRKANWLRDSLLFYYDRLRECGIYDPATGERVKAYRIPSSASGWISQSDLSTHTDFPFLSMEGLKVLCFDYRAGKFGGPYVMDPAARGLPATNREMYPLGDRWALIGAKASHTELNQWWLVDSFTGGGGWEPLPHRGRSHPSLTQDGRDGRDLVVSSHEGLIKCESLSGGEPIAVLGGYRHQHGCFRWPWYVFSSLCPTEPRDHSIHLWRVDTGEVVHIADLPARNPQRFAQWSTPSVKPDGTAVCWKQIGPDGRLDVLVKRLTAVSPPPS